MRRFLMILTTFPLLGSCAGLRSESGPPPDAVIWPVGIYDVMGRVTFPAGVPATASRMLHATLIVDAGNVIQLVDSNAGPCGGGSRSREGGWTFSCGDAGFRLESDGESIRGMVWASATYFAQTGERRCMQYRTDPDGRRECLRWDEPEEVQKRVRGSGQLSVTTKG